MPWQYVQATGRLIHEGELVATGYSGQPQAKNDAAREREHDVGPIPRGRYAIGRPYNSTKVGPFALPLHPMAGTETYGRGDFRIHGDSRTAPGTASHGCIILPRPARERIEASGDAELEVV